MEILPVLVFSYWENVDPMTLSGLLLMTIHFERVKQNLSYQSMLFILSSVSLVHIIWNVSRITSTWSHQAPPVLLHTTGQLGWPNIGSTPNFLIGPLPVPISLLCFRTDPAKGSQCTTGSNNESIPNCHRKIKECL
jgi:hypothetical protein